MVKNLPTMGKTWVQSLGWENPLEEGMATHSGILAWRMERKSIASKIGREFSPCDKLN